MECAYIKLTLEHVNKKMNLIQNTFEKNSSREGIPSLNSSVLVFMLKNFFLNTCPSILSKEF